MVMNVHIVGAIPEELIYIRDMPLGKNVSKNIKELYKDNKKKGKTKGANGKTRSRKQIAAIAISAARKKRA